MRLSLKKHQRAMGKHGLQAPASSLCSREPWACQMNVLSKCYSIKKLPYRYHVQVKRRNTMPASYYIINPMYMYVYIFIYNLYIYIFHMHKHHKLCNFPNFSIPCSLRILRSFHSIPTGATDANDAWSTLVAIQIPEVDGMVSECLWSYPAW